MALAILPVLLGASARAEAAPRFGTWSPGEPYSGSVSGVDRLEHATGRRVDIVSWYENWGDAPLGATGQQRLVQTVTGSGRTPLLTWEPRDPQQGVDQPAYGLARIADGSHDAYITAFARDLRGLGGPIYLRPMHEMNGNWYPWGVGVNGNTAAQFVLAWRRMHDIFAAQGATNVRWVWSPDNFDSSSATPLEALYPGAAYVDVLAADGYNWGSARPQFGGWQSFTQIFQRAYDRLAALGPQPIWFAEVGAAPNGGDKPAWVRDMFARAPQLSRLEAIVWFNEYKELDWRADADPAVAAAFHPSAAAILPWLDEALSSVGGLLDATAGAARDLLTKTKSRGSSADDDEPLRADGDQRSKKLHLHSPRRVRAHRQAHLRWTAVRARRVRRWKVYLDGRRRATVWSTRASSRHLHRRVTGIGTHRWRVAGLDAQGRRLMQASITFRVVP